VTKGYLLPVVVLLSLNQQVEEGKEVLKVKVKICEDLKFGVWELNSRNV
jgi:hypothetical protein